MRKLAIFIMLTTLFSCESTSNKTAEKTTTDTIKTKTDGVIVAKPDSIAVKETVKIDSIRNYKDTQMNEEFFQKAVIDLRDSSLNVYQNIRADYRIFGYQKPDTNSKKVIFFSVFTSDVENNPYQCVYGSYYHSGAMADTKIKYVKNNGNFVEAHLIKENQILPAPIYFLKNWVEFEKRN